MTGVWLKPHCVTTKRIIIKRTHKIEKNMNRAVKIIFARYRNNGILHERFYVCFNIKMLLRLCLSSFGALSRHQDQFRYCAPKGAILVIT